jgi:hypothetical protein
LRCRLKPVNNENKVIYCVNSDIFSCLNGESTTGTEDFGSRQPEVSVQRGDGCPRLRSAARTLTLAAYHYNGWATDAEGGNIRRIRWGGGAKYDDGRWLARGEYIRGKTAELHSEGAYGVVGYFVHPRVQTLHKYDRFTRDVNDGDTRLIY